MGKNSISSLAAPTQHDEDQFSALSEEKKIELIEEAIEKARRTGYVEFDDSIRDTISARVSAAVQKEYALDNVARMSR